MMNKILLPLFLCMLISVPCYADDVSSDDVSENEIVSEVPDVPLLTTSNDTEVEVPDVPLLTTSNDTEVIDYSEYLDDISCYFSYIYRYEKDYTDVIGDYYSSFIFHCNYSNGNYDSSTFVLTSEGVTETVSISEFLSYWYDEEFSESRYVVNRSNDPSLNKIVFYDGDAMKMIISLGTPSVPNSPISDCDVISIDYMELKPIFDYAPTRDQIDTLNENLLSLKDSSDTIIYLLLFLVLERILYIAWDLFPKKGV